MQTVKRWAFDPETDQDYEIDFPSSEAVQAALLALDYPAHGMSSMDATNRLAEYFSLTNLQRNVQLSAQTRYGVFSHLVNTEANNLARSGQLVKPRRGWFAKPEQIREGSESDTAPSISAVATGDTPVEDNLFPHHTALNRRYFMETVTRTAFDPETDQAYEVELPSNGAVQAALLALDYPARGMSTKDVVNQLAEHFSLTDRQRNARGSAQSNYYKLFRNVVTIAANNLVKSGQLMKPRRGWFAKPEQIREGSESDTAPSISAVAARDNPVEDNLAQAAEESIETDYQQIQDALAMETVKRTAFDPETDQAYEVEFPSNEAMQAALLALDYPAHGMSTNDVVSQLAEHFSLTDLQTNARGSAQAMRYKILPNLVTVATNDLVRSGQLVKLRRGWFAKPEQIREGSESDTAPSISAVAARDNPVEDNLAQAAEESIETNYQQIQDALTADLLQRIQDNSPDFFEELVIDLLVAMGYGGSREEAGRAVGGSGDGGIDGVINEDILGLDVIYVQAKRWQADVGEPPVRDFVGALSGRRARKGIFITTSAFSNRAKEYVSSIDSRDTKIVLIDGHQLAQFMIDYNVGVSVTKSYEIKRVDSDYFAEEGE